MRTHDATSAEALEVALKIEEVCGPHRIVAVYLGLAMVIARASLKAEKPNASELGDVIAISAQDEFVAMSRSSRAN
jgi:hypothetical protein